MKLFTTRKAAEMAANKADAVGLTGGGQMCGAVPTTDANGFIGFYFHTAHTVWNNEVLGRLIFEDETVDGDSEKGKEFLQKEAGF